MDPKKQRKQVEIEELSRPEQEELASEQAERAEGGIIIIGGRGCFPPIGCLAPIGGVASF